MGLDELEKLARHGESFAPSSDAITYKLARAVLDMMPVIRLVDEWRDRGRGQMHCDEEGCQCNEQRLREAIDQLRARIGGAK